MNCIEKMYKEIEEIIAKEKAEFARLQAPVKEIKSGFSSFEEEAVTESVSVDFLSNIQYDEAVAQKKYLEFNKAKRFIEYIFKKYAVIVSNENGESRFIETVKSKLDKSDNLIETLNELENQFVNAFGESEEISEYFLNPYNALFKDENGYYAVILNGRFSDVKRPQNYIPNQVKKVIKESLDKYVEDYSSYFNSDKERVSVLNSIKAEINKCDKKEASEIESVVEKGLFNHLSKKGLKEDDFKSYLEKTGYRLVKQ